MKSARMVMRSAERGSILVPIMLVVFLMGTLTVLAMGTAIGVSDRVTFKVEDERLSAIGEAVVDLTMAELWSGYLRACGGEPGNITAFRQYLDAANILAEQEAPADLLDNVELTDGVKLDKVNWGLLKDELDAAGLETKTEMDAFLLEKGIEGLDELLKLDPGKAKFAGAYVHDLSVIREDSAGTVLVRVSATVSFGPTGSSRHSRQVERGYYVAGELFNGFEYGLLANNVNCIMCHANFDNAERYYNKDPDKYGTFGRVRIGTLESMRIRADKTDSRVAGTIYTRGAFIDKDGTPLVNPTDTDLTTVKFTADGMIEEDASGNPTDISLELATGDPLPAGKSLYLDYSTDKAKQVDGAMPASFPPIIPDQNQNRIVDDDELAEVAYQADGSLSGGIKMVVPKGRAYAGTDIPGVDTAGDLAGLVDGNLILKGTPDNPIVFSGRIVIDGDLVIVGTIKGSGEIIARGNVYVVGPILYADGTDEHGNRTFGVDQEGNENRLTLGAGGNIMVGDFLMTKTTMNGDLPADAKIDPVVAADLAVAAYEAQLVKVAEKLAALEAAILKDKDKDIQKAQDSYDKEVAKLPGLESALPPSYFGEPEPVEEQIPDESPGTIPAPAPDDPRPVDPRAISGDKFGLDNFTASELTLFNQMEWTKTQAKLPNSGGTLVDNPLYIPDYVPRYYNVYPDNPVYAYISKDVYFSPETKSWLGKEHISGFDSDGVAEFVAGGAELTGATISSLMPNGRWLTDTQLINFWFNTTQTITNGTPFEMNAVLYSNNATMFLSRKASVYGGQAIVNGGLIGSDLGILVPGNGGVGLQLNYDMRHVDRITLRNLERVTLVRGPRLR